MLEGLLISPEEMKEKKRDGEKIGKAFLKYQDAVKKINFISWIKNEIEKSSGKTLIVSFDDVVNEMGDEFKKYKYGTLYQALRYILFYYGFNLGGGVLKNGNKVFVISEKKKGDRLPESYIEVEKRAEEIEERNKRRIEKKAELEKELLTKVERKRIERKVKNKEIDEKLQEIKIKREKLIIDTQTQKAELKNELNILKIEKEEIKKLRKELKEIEEFRDVLVQKFENKIYLAEIFQFNWKNLTWKLIKRKFIKNYLELFDTILKYNSALNNRYRLEITTVHPELTEKSEFRGIDKKISP